MHSKSQRLPRTSSVKTPKRSTRSSLPRAIHDQRRRIATTPSSMTLRTQHRSKIQTIHKISSRHTSSPADPLYFSFDGKRPRVDPSAYIAPHTVIVGDVTIAPGSLVLSHCAIRGDNAPITLGHHSNIQEHTVVHTDVGIPVSIGNYVSIGHKAMIHGATIHNNVIVGMGATIMNHSIIGENCIIGAGALVTEKKTIPPNSLVMGSPAKVVRELTPAHHELITRTAQAYCGKIAKFHGMEQLVASDVIQEVDLDKLVQSNTAIEATV